MVLDFHLNDYPSREIVFYKCQVWPFAYRGRSTRDVLFEWKDEMVWKNG